MMIAPTMLLEPRLWAEATCGTAQLGDPRHRWPLPRRWRASQALRCPSNCIIQRRWKPPIVFCIRQVSYEALLQPHVEHTREEMGQVERVLLIQDTTEVDYQHHPTTTGLGPIGTGSHHGFLLQSVLAVVPESRQVLGLAHQEPFLRIPAPPGETKWQRARRAQRESQVWERSVRSIGRAPARTQWIHVGDRASDMFPFLRACVEQDCDCVVRASADRCVDLLVEQAERPVAPRSHHKASMAHPAARHLFEVAAGWQGQDERDLELDATKSSPARTAHVVISFDHRCACCHHRARRRRTCAPSSSLWCASGNQHHLMASNRWHGCC